MTIKSSALLFIFLISISSWYSCRYDKLEELDERITLIRYPFPETQTEQEFIDGTAWLFSYLGAELPKDKFAEAVKLTDNKLAIKLDLLGFNSEALDVLRKIVAKLKNTQEYEQKGGIDAGRFFAICFNSSQNYYKITGASKSISSFWALHTASTKKFACDSSAIAKESRLIEYYAADQNAIANFFVSHEGRGFFSSSNFVKSGVAEVFDYMKNGQPRFMIFDESGMLKPSSNPMYSNAGKPAKCMWCHESGIQPLYRQTIDIANYIEKQSFLNDRNEATQNLENYHKNQTSYINFSDKKIHTQAEFIYLSFFEPNTKRLALEWEIDGAKVEELLRGIKKHSNNEFSFLTDVYFRREVEVFAPIKSLWAADDAREYSVFEPEY